MYSPASATISTAIPMPIVSASRSARRTIQPRRRVRSDVAPARSPGARSDVRLAPTARKRGHGRRVDAEPVARAGFEGVRIGTMVCTTQSLFLP